MAWAEQRRSKVFYGWRIVLVAAVGLFLHYGPIIAFTFGVFLKPLSQEFGWSRAEISLAFSLATLGAGSCWDGWEPGMRWTGSLLHTSRCAFSVGPPWGWSYCGAERWEV